MKMFFLALVALAMVPALYAADDTPYRNVCDSLSLGEQPVIELVPAYIEESNWYGNPHTWAKDSSNSTRHESYKTVTVSAKSFANKLPLSISAECRERRGTEFKYATWNNSKQWKEDSEDGIATYIFDIHNMKLDGYDSTNTYNLLGMAPAKIPEDNSYNSGYMLASKTFEFAFEWWFVGLTHEFVFDTVINGNTYGATGRSYSSSIGMDSLHVFEVARNAMDFSQPTRTIRSEYVRVQALKVVLVDSRKPLLPESSSSNPPASSSSEVKSSSSETPVVSSSSETPGPTSSEENSSSSHGLDESSSSVVGTSSSTKPETSSSAEPGTSSSGDAPASSSSGTEPASSSSEGSTRLVTAPAQGATARVVQVRTLDGSIVKNSATLAPGVYYMKYSDGKWHKTAVLPR